MFGNNGMKLCNCKTNAISARTQPIGGERLELPAVDEEAPTNWLKIAAIILLVWKFLR